MDALFMIIPKVFGAIVFLAGAALFIFGLKTSFGERRRCTLSTYGIVHRKLYDYTDSITDPTGARGGSYPCGLRLLINIDGEEHNVFNETYDTAYERFSEGDRVRVKVNPDDPSDYYVNEGASPGVSVCLIGIGMMIAGAAIFMYFRF